MKAAPDTPIEPDDEPPRRGRVGVFDRPSWFARNRAYLLAAAIAAGALVLVRFVF